jgi:hypothetical protein
VEIIETYLNKLDENNTISNEIEMKIRIDKNDFEDCIKSYIVYK